MKTTTTTTLRDYFVMQAHEFLNEYVARINSDELCKHADSTDDYFTMATSLANTFARWHVEEDSQLSEARAIFTAVLAGEGGLVYLPSIDGAPAVITAESLRAMTYGATSWDDAIRMHGGARLPAPDAA